MQSGDDAVLARMGRPYDSAFMKDLIHRINAEIPEACIGLDVMVGFPGEDEKSFARTRELIENPPRLISTFSRFRQDLEPQRQSSVTRVPDAVATQRVEELRILSARLSGVS